MASEHQKQKPVHTFSMMDGQSTIALEGDKDLLESGFLSDVKVICGDKTWNLHKTILCSRSTYFKKAFTGKFQEAETGCIEIYEQDPTEVNWVINILYTSKATPDLDTLLWDERLMASTTVRIFTIADFFGLDRLGDIVVNQLSDNFREMAKLVQRDLHSYVLSDSFITGFFRAAAQAYSCPLPSIRKLQKVFVEFFELTRFMAVQDTRFRTHLKEVPALSHDILMSLVTIDGPSMVLFQKPEECYGCHITLPEEAFFPLTWVGAKGAEDCNEEYFFEVESYQPEGFCQECAQIYKEDPDRFNIL